MGLQGMAGAFAASLGGSGQRPFVTAPGRRFFHVTRAGSALYQATNALPWRDAMKTIRPLFILLSLFSSACGTASVAQRDLNGGQIALTGGYMSSVRQARTLMAEECHGHFDVGDTLAHGLTFHCQEAQAVVTLAKR